MEITVVDAVSTWELNDALSHDDREVRRTNHGVVTQIDDDGQIWVRLAGADTDTPIAQTTVSVDAGDSVTVRIQDGRAYIDGSISNPSASSSGLANVDSKAIQALTDAATAAQAAIEAVADAATARQAATEAVESAETAQDAAEAAQGSADDAREAADKAIFSLTDLENVVGTVNWIAEHGEYVLTEDTAIVDGKPYYTRSGTSPDYIYTVVAEPVASELSTYYELHLDESVQNFLASHIWLDQYGLNIAVSNTNAYRIHQGTVDGTKTVGMYVLDASGNIVADFTASGAQIGKTNSTHVNIDSDSFDVVGSNGVVSSTFGANSAQIGKTDSTHVVIDSDAFDICEGQSIVMAHFGYGTGTAQTGMAIAPYYSLGPRTSGIVGNYSVSEGYENFASGYASHAEGYMTKATAADSHAEGYMTEATAADSHAEGFRSSATNDGAHAEGCSTASGYQSHAEGGGTTASGMNAHAEGGSTIASGNNAHAQNIGTIAASPGQTALGWYNVADSGGNYAVIIGNGSSDNGRSNALTVDWNGGVVADGTIRSNSGVDVRDDSIDRDADTISVDDWATSYFRCQDKDGDVIAVLRNAQRTTGRMDTFLYVYNDDTTGESYTDNYIRLSVARDGTRTYAVGDPSAFRNALGINTWGFATGASDTTLSNSETKVLFTSITTSGCTLSSGGIKVNAAGNYEISGSYEFRTGFTANDICHIIVKNGTTVIAHALWRTYSANPYYTMTLPPFVAQLSANDTIYMYVYNQGGARGIGRATASQGNGLYVKRLN